MPHFSRWLLGGARVSRQSGSVCSLRFTFHWLPKPPPRAHNYSSLARTTVTAAESTSDFGDDLSNFDPHHPTLSLGRTPLELRSSPLPDTIFVRAP